MASKINNSTLGSLGIQLFKICLLGKTNHSKWNTAAYGMVCSCGFFTGIIRPSCHSPCPKKNPCLM